MKRICGGVDVPHDPNSGYALPALIASAGDTSLVLADYAKFLRLHLDGLRDTGGILRATTIQRLHDPVGTYACGWAIGSRDGETISLHFGSAGTFLCWAAICTRWTLAFAVIANSAHEPTHAGMVSDAPALRPTDRVTTRDFLLLRPAPLGEIEFRRWGRPPEHRPREAERESPSTQILRCLPLVA